MPYDGIDVFPVGSTLSGLKGTDTSLGSTYGAHALGYEFWSRDTLNSTGRPVKRRAVRNSSGAALLPKRMVILNASGTAVDGYTRTPDQKAGGIVDQALPTAGVATNDIFWLVIKGPSLCLPSLSAQVADIAVGDRLVAQTAATSGATTAGRPLVRVVSAATADATAGQRNITYQDGVFARAMSTALTNGTGDILVDVGEF